MRRSLLAIALGLLSWNCAKASDRGSDSISYRIYFRQASPVLETGYKSNQAKLDSLCALLQVKWQNSDLGHIKINSGASPEGNTKFNKVLSEKRGEALRSYLQGKLMIPDSVFVIDSRGQDWEGLEVLVRQSEMPNKQEVLHILRNTPEWIMQNGSVIDGKKMQLKKLNDGKAWRYMYRNFFPTLRNSSVIECEFKKDPNDTIFIERTDTVVKRDTVVIREKERDTIIYTVDKQRNFYMAVKTNMLYDVMLIPNLYAEFYLGKGWSLAAGWMHGWWNSDRRHYYWRLYGGELNLRKYFGRAAAKKPLTGHHVGIYGQAVTYDFELGGKGVMGGKPGGTILDLAHFGAGLEYGYSKPIARRLNLDFSLGLGYLGGKCYEYVPQGNCYVWQYTKKRNWFGPTKAEISLVWLIGRGNVNKK